MTSTDPDPAAPRNRGEHELNSGLHRRLTLNSLSNLLRYGVLIVLSFILTPFVVRTLGDSLYGFWIILLSFVGYAGILELGVQTAVVKLVGQHRGAADAEKLSRLLGSAFVFFTVVGLLSALFLAFVLPFLLPHLARHAPAALTSRPLFILIALDAFIIFQNSFLAGVLFGWQLYPAKNFVDIASWTLNAVLLLLFLESEGIVFVAAVKTATDLMALLATLWVVRRVLPGFRLNVRAVSLQTVRELLAFGGRLFISTSTTRVATYAHPLVVSARLSTAATTFFSIPMRLVEYVREITWSLAAGFLPAFSELEARRERDLLRSIYLRYSRYLLVAVMPMYVLLGIYGAAFIGIWIGPEYGTQAFQPILWIAAAALVENVQPLCWRLFIGVGRLDLPVTVSAGASLLSILLGFALAPALGIAGPALAIFVAALVAQVFYTLHASRYLELPVLGLLIKVSLRPLLAGVMAGIPTLILRRMLGADRFSELVLGALVFLAFYLPVSAVIALDKRERAWLRTRLVMLRRVAHV